MADIEGDDGSLRELALFAGAGGGILGGKLLGWRTVCAVECNAYAASVLVSRQNDGILEPFPIWDDVRSFDGRPWRGIVDVVSGGFPCQDISAAGKGAGIDGERSGLWSEMARIIGEVRPSYAFVENSPMLTSRGLGRVLGDLAAMGFDAEWGVISAEDAIWIAGDPCLYHERERIWVVAKSSDAKKGNAGQLSKQSTDAWRTHSKKVWIGLQHKPTGLCKDEPYSERSSWWSTEPALGRVANGVASGMDRLAAIGNGQVSLVAAIAWEILSARLTSNSPTVSCSAKNSTLDKTHDVETIGRNVPNLERQ
jgi:DNA (cytosine-5)-methyltransferase 1